ncbi:MAG: hypothetical protein K6E84_00025 [Lachnospiraceae bacterium]|nr:hypothetical protein [Lachnospiraceae bacterium]
MKEEELFDDVEKLDQHDEERIDDSFSRGSDANISFYEGMRDKETEEKVYIPPTNDFENKAQQYVGSKEHDVISNDDSFASIEYVNSDNKISSENQITFEENNSGKEKENIAETYEILDKSEAPLKDELRDTMNAALKGFNTKRLFTEKESKKHRNLRTSCEDLNKLKDLTANKFGLRPNDPDAIYKGIVALKDKPEDAYKLALKWLENVNEMKFNANRYLDRRDPFSLAGRDRYKGARKLLNIAERELDKCHKALESLPDELKKTVNLSNLYNSINNKYYNKGRVTLNEKVDFETSNNGEKYDEEYIVKQQKKAWDGIYDTMAARAAYNETDKNPKADPKQVNYYNIRRRMDNSVKLGHGMFDLLTSRWDHKTLNSMLGVDSRSKDSIHSFMKEDMNVDMFKDYLPQQAPNATNSKTVNKQQNVDKKPAARVMT